MKIREKKSEQSFLKYTQILVSVILVFAMFFLAKTSLADSTIRGAAWWGDDLEYLYFNCADYESGSRLGSPNNFQDSPEPLGFKFYIGGCVIDHKVKIDANGIFRGQAYNFNKGSVNFGGVDTPVDVPSYSFASNCLEPSLCNAENNCSACYNSENQKIYGYAQVLGTDELIRLDSYQGGENALQLKSWDPSMSTVPFYGDSVQAGDFIGHASATIEGVRTPLSFNCLSENGTPGNDTCAERDNYKVYIGNPEVGQMSAPNWSYENACSPGNARKAVLRWQLKSGSHQAYEVMVTKEDKPADELLDSDLICHSGFKPGSALQYAIPNSNDLKCTSVNDLEYNTNYYWFVRLFSYEDGIYEATPWYQFGIDDQHLGEKFDDNNGPYSGSKKAFRTYRHEFPVPYFTWEPEEIIVGSTTIFNALSPGKKSKYYTDYSPSVASDCSDGSCDFYWSADINSATIGTNSNSTTTIVFDETGRPSVSLKVTDRDNYSCTAKIRLNKINYDLPIWKEVKAE